MQRKLTGVPPLTFVSNGENLVDYRIYGATGGVGDRTRNLFSGRLETGGFMFANGGNFQTNARVRTTYIEVQPDTSYTIQCTGGYAYGVGFYTDKSYIGYEQPTPPSSLYVFKTTERSQRIRISFCSKYGDNIQIDIADIKSVQLEKGSIATTYEPYGYKIPIVCGGTTTNIYLDEPLEENETISMSDTGVSIPTINGSNTLSIGTAVQPSSVYVKYATNERRVPTRTYLQGVEEMDNWAIYNYINSRKERIALQNISTIYSNIVELGDTINITGAAVGGKAPYSYVYYFKKGSQNIWTRKTGVTTSDTYVTIKPSAATNYSVRIVITDTAGTEAEKIITGIRVIESTSSTNSVSNPMNSLQSLPLNNGLETSLFDDVNEEG